VAACPSGERAELVEIAPLSVLVALEYLVAIAFVAALRSDIDNPIALPPVRTTSQADICR
jgi:hypothetical protein